MGMTEKPKHENHFGTEVVSSIRFGSAIRSTIPCPYHTTMTKIDLWESRYGFVIGKRKVNAADSECIIHYHANATQKDSRWETPSPVARWREARENDGARLPRATTKMIVHAGSMQSGYLFPWATRDGNLPIGILRRHLKKNQC